MDSDADIARRLLHRSDEVPCTDPAALLVAQAQVHATLAVVSAIYDSAPVR